MNDGLAESVIASAPGKINLTLRVGAADGRGYHPLFSVFECVSLREYVEIRPAAPGSVSVETLCFSQQTFDPRATAEMALLPPEEHLAVRAIRAVMPADTGADLVVYKSIPAAGGMAGGSADAAAALVAANRLWDLGLSASELEVTGRTLGADVPACLLGGLSVGTGYGDQMTAVDGSRSDLWVLAFATEGLSTPEVFRKFDRLITKPSELPSVQDFDPSRIAMVNDLSIPALALRPELAVLGEAAISAGASEWIISGSGPTVAALVPDMDAVVRVRNVWETFGYVRTVESAFGPVAGAHTESKVPHWAHK